MGSAMSAPKAGIASRAISRSYRLRPKTVRGVRLPSMPEPSYPSQTATAVDIKIRSRDVTEGWERAPARAMLRAIGMTEEDWGEGQVGVASSWTAVAQC